MSTCVVFVCVYRMIIVCVSYLSQYNKKRLLHVTCRFHRLLFFSLTLFLFLYPTRTFISNRTVMVIRVCLTLSRDWILTWHAHQCFILDAVQSVSWIETIKRETNSNIYETPLHQMMIRIERETDKMKYLYTSVRLKQVSQIIT